jgi:hypothetical protein
MLHFHLYLIRRIGALMPWNNETNNIVSDIGKIWTEIYIHNFPLLKGYLSLNMTGHVPRSGDTYIDASKE